jgi:RNA polymerase sigma factor (sigma-70 family)
MQPSRSAQKTLAESDSHLEKLVRSVATGDTQAFRDLYELSHSVLYRWAFKVCRRRETAEDVLHEAFLKIWIFAPAFAPERGSAMAWMMVITRSRAIESMRRQVTNRQNVTFDLEDCDEQHLSSDQLDPGSALDFKRVYEAACWHVDQLKTPQRDLLRLAYLSDMSHSEIASHNAMPIGTVKTHIRRGLTNLRAAMTA